MALVCVEDFEKKAHTVIEKFALDYYRSGAGEQFTLNLNREAFKKWRIRPRFLRDVSKMNMGCKILGENLKWPLGIAPTAMQKLAHPEGECGNARAAGSAGSVFILSTLSTTSIEEVATAAPNTCKWFQLYVYKDRSLTEQLVRRAEKAGFKALVLTIDAPIFGQRRSDVRNKFSLPSHLCLGNFEGIQSEGVRSEMYTGKSGINEYVSSQFDATLTWKDVEWLIKSTYLPVIVKGVLTREDAVLAREFGCAGIIVSNHGARQLDCVPASIEALPEVVKAVGHDMLVMLDGGIMQGNDIFTALALGAKMVFVGRPALWGLACGGQKGVEDMLSVLKNDFEITLALTGCQTLNDINKDMIVHESYYAKL
ncbi:peroxisomal (S)-2-hydroxy-acid oxidase GLO5 [Teleopsis dalmanni]|uniref:peroxisomal (S)-2-hydroxy-acid oxidase GLO5 n=1 Tax=Teleopsis dalmanni TaxID=139649 RepID=UPI0018CCB911|nr:peroxisomal (S)-2-hydroxy-acid oxidase GLO5 [Teleopsis dalmanni]